MTWKWRLRQYIISQPNQECIEVGFVVCLHGKQYTVCLQMLLNDWLDLCIVSPSGTLATNYSCPSSSVSCRRLHLPLAVLKAHCLHHISFSSSLLQVFFGHLLPVGSCRATLILVLQCCRSFFSECDQASSIFFLSLTVLVPAIRLVGRHMAYL